MNKYSKKNLIITLKVILAHIFVILILDINSLSKLKKNENNFNEQVSENDLADTIISIYKNKKIDKVYVKGDKNIQYEKVIRLISILNKGGVENIGLITLPINE